MAFDTLVGVLKIAAEKLYCLSRLQLLLLLLLATFAISTVLYEARPPMFMVRRTLAVSPMFILSILGGWLLPVQRAQCQQTLADVLRKIEPEREKLTSYIVDIHSVGNFDYTGKAKKAAALGQQARLEIDYHIEYSRAGKHAIMARRFKGCDEATDWYVVGESDGVTFWKDDTELQIGKSLLRPLSDGEFPARCFDPLAIGYMALPDMRSNRSLPAMIKGQQQNSVGEIAVRRDGDLFKFEMHSLQYTFDAQRGYWPIHMRLASGGQRIEWKTEVAEVSGHWLPVRAHFENEETKGDPRQVDFTLTWTSVNQPLITGKAAEILLRDMID